MAYVRVLGGIAVLGGGCLAYAAVQSRHSISIEYHDLDTAMKLGEKLTPLPSRNNQLQRLKETKEFDVLVIGGGATGCGVALDSITRGLKTALVEKDDFASATSSRSTKLIHGGVRYLQKAVFNLSYEQFKLVTEALHERANMLRSAPHLAQPLPIMLPVYTWWKVPYFWTGIKMYDLVSGKQLLHRSYYVGQKKALELFPTLKRKDLCGGIVYYDGQQDDARMNVTIALTAARHGASVCNHTEVVSLLKKKITKDGVEKEIVCGARVRDQFTREEWDVHAKCVINATGPYTDDVRRMDDASRPNICQPSAGVHIVLPEYYSPRNMGFLNPETSDGRIVFLLPWEGRTVAGTTDTPTKLTFHPKPTKAEVQFILDEIKSYLSEDITVRNEDVLAAWSGIRPLVRNPKSKKTEELARNHVIDVSDGNLVTIAGGKWTTYRSMASDTVDEAVKCCELKPEFTNCQTDGLVLEGGEGYTPNLYIRLVQEYGVDMEVAKHLTHCYGTKAVQVCKEITGPGKRLDESFPYIEAEVKFAVQEYACTIVDVLARRTRLAFLNVEVARDAVPRVAEIMAKELGWSGRKKQEEVKKAVEYLEQMGLSLRDE
ncbi:glycerol-3-phosphate dehydrogenase, mitochondrial-like [Dendronephthya gigantea]|uniref:glycerol-3-phosphate dehydrogenase, mitochondrial-like n=1 Tax=Dendronephthya gigantea TaxID=151771 RepID=UPI00106A7E8D|nr:glycerol-3-phosphate dehydrogenase, mitochondrial-like [Dendronephthya gigantea]